ncbi:MAG: hypothetical protein KKA32_11125 [Actinobacteria bacterium]|nr:hypothetical protein [Actinomycetota bacterium]
MPADKAKALTVRLPADLYERGKTVVERRNITLNELVIEGLELVVAEEEEAALFAAFGEVGADATMGDVSFSWAAQQETVSGRPPDEHATSLDD